MVGLALSVLHIRFLARTSRTASLRITTTAKTIHILTPKSAIVFHAKQDMQTSIFILVDRVFSVLTNLILEGHIAKNVPTGWRQGRAGMTVISAKLLTSKRATVTMEAFLLTAPLQNV
jgi:hypothetical protein